MDARTAILKGQEQIPAGGTRYEAVNLASVDYVPAEPFRAIHIGEGGAGSLVIVGMDGRSAAMKLAAGLYPFSGLRIIRAGTTAADITAIR